MKGLKALRHSCILFFLLGTKVALGNSVEGESLFTPDEWRTHTTGHYEYNKYAPRGRGQKCYKTVFFGDSLCVGFRLSNLIQPLRSFCSNMAIHFSEIAGNLPVEYVNYSANGATSGQILKQMKHNLKAIKNAHLLVWDSGGNDFLLEAFKFSNPLFSHEYCQLCSLDNELGSLRAIGPDPRCGNRQGMLQKFKSNLKEMLALLGKNAKPDAVIRMMGLYYGHFDRDGSRSLSCVDPDTGTSYKNLREQMLPVVLKGIHTMMDEVNQVRSKGDSRFEAFDTFARFNTEASEFRDQVKYFPNETLIDYAQNHILSRSSDLLDPYWQIYSSAPGVYPYERLIQEFISYVDIHPTQAGHDLIEELSRPSIDGTPLPQTAEVNFWGHCE